MAEATTGNDLTGINQSTNPISRVFKSISNVRRMTSDPAVQKSVPLIFGVIGAVTNCVMKDKFDVPTVLTGAVKGINLNHVGMR